MISFVNRKDTLTIKYNVYFRYIGLMKKNLGFRSDEEFENDLLILQ